MCTTFQDKFVTTDLRNDKGDLIRLNDDIHRCFFVQVIRYAQY